MNFLNYMVKEGQLTQEQKKAAMLKHLQGSPCLAAIVQENNLLKIDDQIRVFETMYTKGLNYQESMNELGFVTRALGRQLESLRLHKIPSIYRILVDDGTIDISRLIHILDEFVGALSDNPDMLEEVRAGQKSVAVNAGDAPTADHNSKPNEIEATESSVLAESPESHSGGLDDGGFSFQLPKFDGFLIEEFLSLLNTAFKVEQTKRLEQLKESQAQENQKSLLTAINFELSNIVTGCQFVGLEVTRVLSTSLLHFNQIMIGHLTKGGDDLVRTITLNEKVFEELYLMKVLLELSHTEATYWQQPERRTSFIGLVKDLR